MQSLIRKSAVSYLLVLVLIKVLAVPVICLHYEFNKAYIAANLCENKNKPALHCNGKCHLRKQLAQTNDTSNSQTQKGSASVSIVDYCEDIKGFSLKPAIATEFSAHAIVTAYIAQGYYGTVFHPPLV